MQDYEVRIKPSSACSELGTRYDASTSRQRARKALAPNCGRRESNGVSPIFTSVYPQLCLTAQASSMLRNIELKASTVKTKADLNAQNLAVFFFKGRPKRYA